MIAEAERDGGYRYEATADGHPLRLRVEEAGYNAWKEYPELTWAAAGAALPVLPAGQVCRAEVVMGK